MIDVGKAVCLRFVVGTNEDDARWLTGIITEACALRDDGHLDSHESDWLNEMFAWLNTHLPCPPFSESSWSPDAVCWFRDDAVEPLRRMWDLVALLRKNGVPVRIIRSEKPGRIVYQDEFQIVAVPGN